MPLGRHPVLPAFRQGLTYHNIIPSISVPKGQRPFQPVFPWANSEPRRVALDNGNKLPPITQIEAAYCSIF
jgi:hypothetical protein